MSYSKLIIGVALSLVSGLAAAQAGSALPIRAQAPANQISQINRPPEQGVPRLLTEEVRGEVVRVGGDEVTLRLENGEEETFDIPAEFENREGLVVGNEVLLIIERGNLVAIYDPEDEVTVIRRETAQEVRPAPAPAPAPAPRPAPAPAPRPAPAPAVQPAQPIRGMW